MSKKLLKLWKICLFHSLYAPMSFSSLPRTYHGLFCMKENKDSSCLKLLLCCLLHDTPKRQQYKHHENLCFFSLSVAFSVDDHFTWGRKENECERQILKRSRSWEFFFIHFHSVFIIAIALPNIASRIFRSSSHQMIYDFLINMNNLIENILAYVTFFFSFFYHRMKKFFLLKTHALNVKLIFLN